MHVIRLLVFLLSVAVIFMSHTQRGRAAEAEEVQASYKVGDGLKVGNEKNQTHLQARLQNRFTYDVLEGTPDTNSFAIQRGKIKAEGYVWEKKLRFGLQLNAATKSRASTTAVCTDAGCTTTANAVTTESTTGIAILEDYYFDWVHSKEFGIKGGQYKVPFLMQELTSSGKQQFVDRGLATDSFNLRRDLGITFHGNFMQTELGYSLFVMNGDGVNTSNRNKSVLTGIRFELPILGTYVTSESDTDNSLNHNLGVGAAYVYNKPGATSQDMSHETLDVGYKYVGWSFQGAGMISRASTTTWGYNVQVGKFIIPKHLEVALKNGGVIIDGAANPSEYSTGLNYFVVGHGIKLQLDYATLINARGQDINDNRIRAQMQVIF